MILNTNATKKDFLDGKSKGYTHMIVFTDVLQGNQISVYIDKNSEVDDVVENFCAVDTFRVAGIFNYTLNFDLQLSQLVKQKSTSYCENILTLKK